MAFTAVYGCCCGAPAAAGFSHLRENLSGRIVQVGLSPPVTFTSLHCTRHGLAPGHSGLVRPESMHTVSSLQNIDLIGYDPPPAGGVLHGLPGHSYFVSYCFT